MTQAITSDRRRRRIRPAALLGRHPLGILFAGPYTLFIAAVFAYPLGLAVWMSFHRYIFTAPGVSVPRPFVGLDNYRTALSDPAVRQAFGNIVVFLVINVPLTVALSLGLATALNAAIPFRTFFRLSYYLPYVTASVAVVAVWLFLFNSDRNGQPDPRFARAASVVAGRTRTWRCRRPRSTSPGSSSASTSCCTWRRCRTCPRNCTRPRPMDGASAMACLQGGHRAGVRPATTLVLLLSTDHRARTSSPSRTCSPAVAGRAARPASPVLVMYQRGIEQGHPDVGAAIGVLLVIGVLIVGLVNHRLTERR